MTKLTPDQRQTLERYAGNQQAPVRAALATIDFLAARLAEAYIGWRADWVELEEKVEAERDEARAEVERLVGESKDWQEQARQMELAWNNRNAKVAELKKAIRYAAGALEPVVRTGQISQGGEQAGNMLHLSDALATLKSAFDGSRLALDLPPAWNTPDGCEPPEPPDPKMSPEYAATHMRQTHEALIEAGWFASGTDKPAPKEARDALMADWRAMGDMGTGGLASASALNSVPPPHARPDGTECNYFANEVCNKCGWVKPVPVSEEAK